MPRKSTYTKRNNKTKNNNKQKPSKNYASIIILFAAAILLFALMIVPGDSLWRLTHEFIFGLSGFMCFCLPVLLLYLVFMLAADKDQKNVKVKVWLSFSMIILICTCVYTFETQEVISIKQYFGTLIYLYEEGTKAVGSGLLGGIFGLPLVAALGTTGARITIIILIFVNFMFLTGNLLIKLLNSESNKDNTNLNKKEIEKMKAIKAQEKRFAMQSKKKAKKNKNKDMDIDIKLDEKENKAKDDLNLKLETKNNNKIKAKAPKTDDDSGAAAAAAAYIEKQNKETTNKFEKDLEKAYDAQVSKASQKYKFPPVELLKDAQSVKKQDITKELKENGQILVDTLKSFGVQTKIIDISRGPAVTRYELQPGAGVKISKITNLADDIALNLAAAGVRIEAPIPGKAAVGIEIPNKNVQIVKMKEIIKSQIFNNSKSKITVALGRDIAGKITLADLSKMPHLLIAGSTGSGKSVCINSLIISMLYKATPDEVKFLMIDPKVVELGHYNAIPHLMVPVVTDARKAAGALNWAVSEMIKRYRIFAQYNVRDLASYNKMVEMYDGKPPILRESKDQEDDGEEIILEKMPQVVIIIDELADLMMVAPHEVEDSICRLAQMARAAGMHLVIATQRPSVDVITGIIKANIPSRIAFAVSSAVDSRTILDSGGAEKLIGRGDMLFAPIGVSKPLRVQGCFLTDEEIENVVNYVKNTKNEFDKEIIEEIERNIIPEKNKKKDDDDTADKDDIMLDKAIEVVVEAGQASTSFLQRKLRLGYARAARIMDALQERGVVSAAEGAKPRKVLLSKQQLLERNLNKNMEETSKA